MYRLGVFVCLVLVCMSLPPPARAADGASCPTTGRIPSDIGVSCTLICDSKTSADTTCSTYTIDLPADTYVFEIANATGCSGAASVDIDQLGETGSIEHPLTALAIGGTTLAVVQGSAAQPLTLLDLDLSTMTDCTDFDVKLWRFYENR